MPRRRSGAGSLERDRKRLAAAVAAFMHREWCTGAAPSKFTYEAQIRHGLRSGLCLNGARWDTADHHASMVLQEALRRINAIRPSWLEGQSPDFQDRGDLISRERCLQCRAPLLGALTERFCSRHCRGGYRVRQGERWMADATWRLSA